jgi:hypothetical protein
MEEDDDPGEKSFPHSTAAIQRLHQQKVPLSEKLQTKSL